MKDMYCTRLGTYVRYLAQHRMAGACTKKVKHEIIGRQMQLIWEILELPDQPFNSPISFSLSHSPFSCFIPHIVHFSSILCIVTNQIPDHIPVRDEIQQNLILSRGYQSSNMWQTASSLGQPMFLLICSRSSDMDMATNIFIPVVAPG